MLNILVAAIVHMGIGFVWFGPLFGKAWLSATGLKPKRAASRAYVGFLISSLVTSYVLAYTLKYFQVATIMLAIQIGFWVWLGFVATTMLPSYLFERRPLKLYAINAGYYLAGIVVMSAILTI